MYLSLLPAYKYTMSVFGVHEGRKTLDPLCLELRMSVIHYVGSRNQTWGPLQERQVFLTNEASLQSSIYSL